MIGFPLLALQVRTLPAVTHFIRTIAPRTQRCPSSKKKKSCLNKRQMGKHSRPFAKKTDIHRRRCPSSSPRSTGRLPRSWRSHGSGAASSSASSSRSVSESDCLLASQRNCDKKFIINDFLEARSSCQNDGTRILSFVGMLC